MRYEWIPGEPDRAMWCIVTYLSNDVPAERCGIKLGIAQQPLRSGG
jgi:hypothetical protein